VPAWWSCSLARPRSWTGSAGLDRKPRVRIGLTAVKGWAEVYAKPAVAVSALEALGEGGGGAESGLAGLLARGRQVLLRCEETERRRRELATETADLRKREREAREAEGVARERLEAWKEAWAVGVKNLPVEAGESRAAAIAVLERLDEIFDKLKEAERLRERIDGIDREAREFHGAATALVDPLVPDLAGLVPEVVVARLYNRLGEARGNAARRLELLKQREERTRALEEANRKMANATERLSRLCQQAHRADPQQLPTAEQRSAEVRRHREQLEVLEAQVLERAEGASIEEIEQEAASANREAIPAEIERVLREIDEWGRSEQELSERIGAEAKELGRMDHGIQANEAAERAQSLLAEIREGAERYLQLRLAYLVLRRQVERYRAENQGPLLSRASELFARLTLGSFARLDTDFNEKDQPILVGVRPSGRTVPVDGMSDGARDQLYLALRLSSIERHSRATEPLPLILDDTLVHFDDHRAGAALSILAEFAAKSQVLLFTHHARVVEIAKQVCGEQTVVRELENPSS